MVLALYSFASSLVVSFLLMPLLIKVLHKQHILDEGGRRKIHKGQIPTMGGVVIFLAFAFAMLAWLPANDVFNRRYLFSAILLIFVTGFRDDIAPLRPLHKLIAQLVASCVVVCLADIRIVSFYGFMGIQELPYWLSVGISVFTIIVVTNAFNLIDGIDGLAGTIASISFTFLAVWFYLTDNVVYAIVMCALIGAILGFLYYNWHRAVIFMGDTGSLVVGFLLAISTIAFLKTNGTLPDVNPYKFTSPIAMAMTIVLFPLFDTLRVFILRVLQKKSPFSPDKQHIHHYMLRMGHSHDKATLVIGAVFASSIIAMQLFARKTSDVILVPALIILCFMVNGLLRRSVVNSFRRKREI